MIKSILSYLISSGYKAKIEPKNELITHDQILVGIDDTHFLQIRVNEQNEINTIHFFVVLPFKINKKYGTEVARYCSYLNKMYPYVTFVSNEVEEVVCLQYTLVTSAVEEKVLDFILAQMAYALTYAESFKELSFGKKRLDDLL